LKSARQFVDALYEIVEQTLNTGRSRSGFGESIQYRRDASDIWTAAREMQASISRIIESGKPDHEDLKQLFDKSVESFDKYYEAEEAFRLATYGMLSGNGMRNVESHVTTQLWQHRLDYLEIVESDLAFLLRKSTD
jgi:hypothetical protein